MRILIVRHCDPDYSIDSLTEKGWKEAELLSLRLQKEQLDGIYCSPLGRARDTANVTLKKIGREAIVKDWLREFDAGITWTNGKKAHNCWDLMPGEWTRIPNYYDKDHWTETPVMQSGPVESMYRTVAEGLDEILAEYGYVREGNIYRVREANRKTLVFFCHFGVSCVLLSHLLGVSPMVLWHGFCAPASSVTTLYTEEREEGIASIRCQSFGDISHLYAGGEPAAFAARFCETYDNMDERH